MRKTSSSKRHDCGRVYTTKSFFGSHADMIVDDISVFDIQLKENEVICKDDGGYYVTLKNRIDTGLADPNRYSSVRFAKQLVPIEKKEV
jgi:hypothetical protein